MTVSSQTRKAGPYSGTGSTGPFTFSFKVFQASDLLVVKANTTTNAETTLALTTDYTVSLNADQNANPGGTVTLVAPLAVGYKMVIGSQVPYLQETDLTNQGGFYPEVITDALDKLTIETQQLREQVDRSAKLPITYTSTDLDQFTADIIRLADSADNIDTVAAHADNVDTVAGSVANVNTVGTNISSVNTTADSIANVNTTAGAIANVNTVADNIANVNTVAGIASDVTTVAGIAGNVTTVSGISTNVTTVAGIAGNVTTVGTNINEVEVVAADLGGVRFTNDLGLITDPVTGPGPTAPGAITTVAIDIADVKTVAGISTNVTAVAGNATNIDAVAGNATNINAVAGNATNIDAVAGNATNINAVNANKTNIDAVAGNATNINTVATNIASVNNTSTNMAAVIDAPNQAAAAAASAAAAAASAASGMYSAVQDKSADYTVVVGDAGDLIRMTTSGGARTVTLPFISTLPDGFNVTVVKWTGDINSVTVQRSGTDLINGSTSYVLDAQYKSATFVADKETSTWFASGAGGAGTNIIVDAFNGTGSQTAFTLSGDPGSENNTQVYVAGVYQEKDTYSLSGSTLTFSAAPPVGTSNIEVVWSQPLAIGVPSDSSVSTVKLADNAVTTVKVADAAITSAKLAATLDLGVL